MILFLFVRLSVSLSILLNYLPLSVSDLHSDIGRVADDTKIGRSITSDSDVIALQIDLDRMNEWTGRW